MAVRRGRTVARVWCSALLWTGCLLLAVAPAAAAFKYTEVGDPAPRFALHDLQGEEVRLEDRLGPKALAVAFWATWSPRSRALLDDLEAALGERRAHGLEVLAVNVDHEHLGAEDRAAVETMAAGWSFPVLVDEGLATYYAYGVVATPSLALLDEKGEVRFVRASYSTAAQEEILGAVDALLGVAGEEESGVVAKKREYVPPKKATLHYQKAQVLVQRGMGRKAVRDLEAAAKLDPAWADPRILLARVQLAEGRGRAGALEGAEKALLEVVDLQARNLQAHALLAELRLALGKDGEALAAADEALGLEPGYTPAILARAKSLRALGRLAEAREALEEALEIDPRNPSVFAELGEVLAATGSWKEASESLRRAVEIALGARTGEG